MSSLYSVFCLLLNLIKPLPLEFPLPQVLEPRQQQPQPLEQPEQQLVHPQSLALVQELPM
jgi:hypothetical protein